MIEFDNTLDTLVSHLFDYAGMFPPEEKPLVEALKASARFPYTLERPHLVGTNLVLPLNSLESINVPLLFECGFKWGGPLFLSLLFPQPLTKQSTAGSLDAELGRVREFNKRGASGDIRQKIIACEFKTSVDVQDDIPALQGALSAIKTYFADEPLLICVEPNLSTTSWQTHLSYLAGMLRELNQNFQGPPLALKIRGAGPTAVNIQKLAEILEVACEYDLDLKATAGLHHPIIEKERYKNELGFLNLSVALFLRLVLGKKGFSREEIVGCLSCSNSSEFTFGEMLGWKKVLIPHAELRAAKEEFFFSIGSCSIDEPDAGLQRLFPVKRPVEI